MKMTIKDSIIKTLEISTQLVTSTEVCNYIIAEKLYDFKIAKTPSATVSAQLGDFIRTGDSRVKRVKQEGGVYGYYLAKKESELNIDSISEEIELKSVCTSSKKTYSERDLHKLLSSYLKNTDVYSKTIFHEHSKNGKDNNQIWTHPDMVGIKYLKLQTRTSQSFIKSINRLDTFKISSYELKREINSDSELKKAYFQAVSNSSWAHYGYLVAFEIGDSLLEEVERLNQSFGIGIIELNSNPFKSKTLYPAKYRDLDFKTIDKLCKVNREFDSFIEQSEKLMSADDRYYKAIENELNEYCDSYLETETEIETYCKDKNIPKEK